LPRIAGTLVIFAVQLFPLPLSAEEAPFPPIDSLRPPAGDDWGSRDSLVARRPGAARVPCGGETPCPCGGTVVEDYLMTEDLLGCPDQGLIVGSDSIVIDCNGHRIAGTGKDVGIWIPGRRHVTIRNCRITDYRMGILAFGTEDLDIRENRLENNRVTAAWVTRGTNVRIVENHIEGNGVIGTGYRIGAIATLESTTVCTIADNIAHRNGNAHAYVGGILLQASSHNKIRDNVLTDTGEDNIWIRFGGGFNEVTGNSITGSGMDGIWIRESHDNAVENNVLANIDLYGIYVRSGCRNSIKGNRIERAGLRAWSGIGIGGEESPSLQNVLSGNEVYSSREGILVHEYAHDNVFSENLLSGNGIGVRAGYGLFGRPNRVERTVIERSEQLDVVMQGRESTLLLVGSTFDPNLVRVHCSGGSCRIEVRWYVTLRVEDESGNPVGDATLLLRDVFGNIAFSGNSGADGSVPVFEAVEYVQDPNGRTEFNEHVLLVQKEGFETAALPLRMNGDLSRTVVLAHNPVMSVASGSHAAELALDVSPNPVRGETAVRFALPSPARVRVDLYDVRGRLAARIVEEDLPAGPHGLAWNGGRSGGRGALPPGTYFVRLAAGERSITKKIVLAGD
ncbi:MAG: right-handed parallel beta-helix repeat-containing protein, partial [Candidatus Eisenbacteria bacterium]